MLVLRKVLYRLDKEWENVQAIFEPNVSVWGEESRVKG